MESRTKLIRQFNFPRMDIFDWSEAHNVIFSPCLGDVSSYPRIIIVFIFSAMSLIPFDVILINA